MHNEDSVFGDELRLAMRRVEAPSSFADAVLGRLGQEQVQNQVQEPVRDRSTLQVSQPDQSSPLEPGSLAARQEKTLFRVPLSVMDLVAGFRHSAALAAALLFFLSLPLIGYLHQRHQQEQAQAASQQFSLAMRLTHEALEDAGAQIATHRHSHNAD